MAKGFAGKVSGRVQGVGYRYFAEKSAIENKIKGWVRNSPDGTVEITAVGEAVDLEKFLLKLKKGPFPGCVDALDIEWLKDVPHFKDFTITG